MRAHCLIRIEKGAAKARVLAYYGVTLVSEWALFVLTEPLSNVAMAVTEYSTGLRLPGPLLDGLDEELQDAEHLSESEAYSVLVRTVKAALAEHGAVKLEAAITGNRKNVGVLNEIDL